MRRLFIGCLVLAVGCADSTAPMSELARGRSRWAANGPSSYVLTVRHLCFCLPEAVGPARVHVVNGVVQSRTYLDGTPVPAEFESSFPDVPGLFDRVSDAIARRPSHFSAKYDPVYGFPAHVAVDYVAAIADDEFTSTASLATPGSLR